MMNLTTVEYPNAVPTATPAGTCSARIRIGAVMVPAPTPVRAMMTAIMNPIRYSIAIGAPPGLVKEAMDAMGPFGQGVMWRLYTSLVGKLAVIMPAPTPRQGNWMSFEMLWCR